MVDVSIPVAVSAPATRTPARDAGGAVPYRLGAPNATLTRRIDLTASVARFRVRPDDGVPGFEPGQYFALGLTLGDRLLQRPYSTASQPGTSGDLEFLIRRVHGGALTPRLWELPVGARLRIGRPKGLFTLQPGDRRTHLFIATGTGLAPVASMLGALRRNRGSGRPVRAVIVHGVSYVSELAYRERLSRWARIDPRVVYVPVVSRPGHPENAGWAGFAGRVDGILDDLCELHGIDASTTIAYLCGNPEAVAAAARTLAARGFPAGALVSEHYWAASPPASPPVSPPEPQPPSPGARSPV